jgi:DNA-binding response OmpR family regulator
MRTFVPPGHAAAKQRARVGRGLSGASRASVAPRQAQHVRAQVVEHLVRHRGKLVGQRELLRAVWGPNYGSETNYLRVYVAQLRRKLERHPAGLST